MDNLTLSIEDLYEEIKERAFGEGSFSREEWHDLIDEVLDEKRGGAEIVDEDDLMYVRESLQSRFEEFAQDVVEV